MIPLRLSLCLLGPLWVAEVGRAGPETHEIEVTSQTKALDTLSHRASAQPDKRDNNLSNEAIPSNSSSVTSTANAGTVNLNQADQGSEKSEDIFVQPNKTTTQDDQEQDQESGCLSPTGQSSNSSATTPASGATCAASSPNQTLLELYTTSKSKCKVGQGDCVALAGYVTEDLEGVAWCGAEIEKAASACADCSSTPAGKILYAQHLSACQPSPITEVNSSVIASSNVISESASQKGDQQASNSANSAANAVVGEPKRPGSDSQISSAKQVNTTSTQEIVSTGGSSGNGSPATTGGQADPASNKVLVKIVKPATAGAVSGTTDDEVNTVNDNRILIAGSDQPNTEQDAVVGTPVVGTEGHSASSRQSQSASINRINPTGTANTNITLTRGETVIASSTRSASPIKTARPELNFALVASKFFFAHEIDPSCEQADDGCVSWRTEVQNPLNSGICRSSILQSAISCSGCVSAAGKSDQATYTAQNKAYGWYKGNCTLLGGDSKATLSSNGLLAVGSVPDAQSRTSLLDTPNRATSIAQVVSSTAVPLKAEAQGPHIQYVIKDSGAECRGMPAGVGSVVIACSAVVVVSMLMR